MQLEGGSFIFHSRYIWFYCCMCCCSNICFYRVGLLTLRLTLPLSQMGLGPSMAGDCFVWVMIRVTIPKALVIPMTSHKAVACFLWGLSHLAFSSRERERQQRFWSGSFLLLNGLSSQISEPRLHKACGYGATGPPLPLLLSEEAGPPD